MLKKSISSDVRVMIEYALGMNSRVLAETRAFPSSDLPLPCEVAGKIVCEREGDKW